MSGNGSKEPDSNRFLNSERDSVFPSQGSPGIEMDGVLIMDILFNFLQILLVPDFVHKLPQERFFVYCVHFCSLMQRLINVVGAILKSLDTDGAPPNHAVHDGIFISISFLFYK